MPSTGRSGNGNFQDYPISKRVKVAGPVYLWLVSAPDRVDALRQRTRCSIDGNESIFRVVIIIDDEGFKEARMGSIFDPYSWITLIFYQRIADDHAIRHPRHYFDSEWAPMFHFKGRRSRHSFSIARPLLVAEALIYAPVIALNVRPLVLPRNLRADLRQRHRREHYSCGRLRSV